MSKPYVEIEHGTHKWIVYGDGSQMGFPVGSTIRVYGGVNPEVKSAAARANEEYLAWSARVNKGA